MKIIIVGAGFGGLRLARRLSHYKNLEITLVDRFNFHQFQPLFYQVATGGLDPSNISFPIRKIFQKKNNVRIRLAELQYVRPTEKAIVTDIGLMQYDILVLACGATTQFFGNEDLARWALPMKSTLEALNIRYSILERLEKAIVCQDSEERQRLLTFIVVGGGATGVELAGALAEFKRFIVPRDYPEIRPEEVRIFLLEGGSKILPGMSHRSSHQAADYLRKLGVELKLNTLVENFDGKFVTLNNGEVLSSATVVWAAGIRGNVPGGIPSSVQTRGMRLQVDRQCRLLGFDDIFVIGDLACMATPKYPAGHPQVAPVALQQANFVAKFISRIYGSEKKSEGLQKLPEFEYRPSGVMATVGRNLAVADLYFPKWHLAGRWAWLTWMTLHLMLILGVKNKFFVFCNWLYNYLTYDQNLRLLFRNEHT
ncbi:MAG: NAD(P)/FAD-dependent oxidoreductase [Flavobacteriales bacterium]|nr:NAD(P)/FAD-dependent oxidoreductase [Flavobacteriales bacterium]MCX7650796.1 NAD(P)/FAD-dependent oxidoreductase [Flavobacteriales bacterium]MDW8432679.1 NAD(P)/FAD-dependent oxidoreductase [Flavobacteriales bacterium]